VRRIFEMKKRIIIFVGSIILILISPGIISANQLADKIERLKPTVVNLEVTSEVNLGFDNAGKWFGTGFIVDAERGIIATNRHLTSTSYPFTKITFIDGSSTEGKVLYYDYYHDFGFIQFDPSSVRLKLQEASLGSSSDLKHQETVFLIGNNEREEYSVKVGMVVNSRADKGTRHSMTIHTSFDRTGGSSGSPVFNEQEQVIGIHFSGTNTSSFELPIEYIRDALDALRKGKIPQRGDIGVQLGYVPLNDAIKHVGIDERYRKVYERKFPGAKKVIYVQRVIPRSPAENVLSPGDIVWAVRNQLIGDNLYLFDRLVDKQVNQTIKLTVLRREGEVVAQLPVQDLEAQKTEKFVLFGGGTFQDITTRFRWVTGYAGHGIFMNTVRPGTAFASLGIASDDDNATKRVVVIRGLNGKPVHDLNDFIRVAEEIRNGAHTTIVFQDFAAFNASPRVKYTSFNLRFSELKVFEMNGKMEFVRRLGIERAAR